MEQYIFGHRGASGCAPENTLEAFEIAAIQKAHGVELDVQLTRDGELVVAHDEKIDRVANGIGKIRDYTLLELKRHRFNRTHPEFEKATIPTLGEVFQLLKPYGLRINIELKNSVYDYPGLEEKCVELAAREGMSDSVIYSSFNHYSLLRLKAMDPNIYCGLLYQATMVRSWEYAVKLGMNALHPHYTEVLIPGGLCVPAHAVGIAVNTWTVNTDEDIEAVLNEGTDILITNYPARALSILEARNKTVPV